MIEDIEKLRPNPELRPFPTRYLEVFRYRQVSIEVTRSRELVAALITEAVHSGSEIGGDQTGCSRIGRARSAGLTSSS